MPTASPNYFWQYNTDYWLKKLNSGACGLSEQAAAQIHAKTGRQKRAQSVFSKETKLFIAQFKSPLMLLLIGAVVLSAFLGDPSDVVIILFIILSSGLLSFFQERNAGRVVEKLQSMISLRCNVIRDGIEQEIDSVAVVPGDVLVFNAGDIIPADCLILESNELHANESSLTGESFPVRKQAGTLPEQTELPKRTNCLWEGSSIVSGNAKALAIQTGNNSLFGTIVQSASATVETTFEKGIRDFGFFLMKITLVLSIFILFVNLLNHKSVMESALFALALAVGMAPELLPAITNIAMSAGAKRILQKKVIVRKLTSIQNLGEVNLLCTDKTGTITEGIIRVHGLVNGGGSHDEFVEQLAVWNASLQAGYANPIDDALKQLGHAAGSTPLKLSEVPYDFIRKRLSIAVKTADEKLLISKGAFREIAGICTAVRLPGNVITPLHEHIDALNMLFEEYSANGLRAIGIAYKLITTDNITKEDERDLVFAGFILLQDPVKQAIAETIESLQTLHIGLKIITGDNKNVAKSIAMQIGIPDPVIMTGEELIATSSEALVQLAKRTHLFAEVEPQQKERIIQALRKSYTVAYMGDGINDVSAINAADIGISVDNAADVAKEAADIVLMEKDLSVLVDGITEGRKTFANTLKYLYISTGSTFGNMCSVAAASLILPFLPMLPKQILLTNFMTDFPYLAVASDNVDDDQLKKPGKWNLKMIRTYMLVFGIQSSVFDVITFLVLYYVLRVKESAFQTGWFIESVLTELLILFIIRTQKNFFKSRPARSLLLLSVTALALTIVLPYLPFASEAGLIPLPLPFLGAIAAIVVAYVITADLLKVWFFNRYQNS